ncbi:MAG TPA: outer membrane beta-barrel protein [Verrucomicrobiae bacterium]|nr:outer membrane beta-barrel protein [Verrucomicrobiae bacterium]
MKKIFASVGLAALGASTLQAQYAPGLSAIETQKPWSLSASLRGFYDDNYLTLPGHFATSATTTASKRASWGVELAPSISFNHSVEDTLIAASYVYDLRYYEDHSTKDQTHQFNAKLDHQFSERYKLNIGESFVIAQEPTVLDASVVTSPLRVPGNNVRNTGNIDFFGIMTKLLDFHLGYVNTVTAYQQTEGDVVGDDLVPGIGGPIPSRSAALDRMDQLVIGDLRWKFRPETTGVTGAQYEHVDYTSPEYIIFPAPGQAGFRANIRNSDSYFGFVGVDQSFTPNLNGTLRVGGEYVDYYKAHQNEVSPYVDASLTWQYMAQSYVQAGVKHIHNSTDVVGGFGVGATPVLDEESTAAYISLSHTISSLTISVLGQAQFSDFKGGGAGFDGASDDFYVAGINLSYRINPFLVTEAGYNYNRLISDLGSRSYVRNQVYVGIRATY